MYELCYHISDFRARFSIRLLSTDYFGQRRIEPYARNLRGLG